MRINSKQLACACLAATTLAFPMSEALCAGRGAAGGPRAGAVVHRVGPVLPGRGVARGGASGWRAPLPGGARGYQAQASRYGDFGIYGRRQRYGCGEGACGGYWGGGGVYYGDDYSEPNYEVGFAAAGPRIYDPNYQQGIGSGGPGYYDTYAQGRPAALTALPPAEPEYGLPPQGIPVTVRPVRFIEPTSTLNPHIILLEPAP
jgi:hypothetical protein